ncbi:MOP flippase family protein [Flavobacterium sp. ACN6]|uniref:MOP flippase family protein n=1 Tax=Flavobacterium sp. ACN6 TaxID=1920426 RepID=UPI000BB31300|nr:MOP flippase family protein [Flavobacterium sp. ACN6]PBJ13875.1 Lipopolysaccharide biosynthesis protein WzxC [Flavobacterium sp. ACN6]
MHSDLKKRTEKGIKWSIIDQVFKVIISLGISIFLARLIDPSEFGLFAIVTVSVGFLTIFRDFGLSAALIHKDEPTQLEIDSVFWFNNLLALIIALIIFFGAYFAGNFYKDPKLIPLMQIMGLIFFLSAFGLVPDGLIHKHLDFKSFFIKNIINIVLSGSIAIFFAYLKYGVWALIIQTLVSTILEVVISFRMIKWRPRMQFSWPLIKPFLKFSMPLLGENTINYWVRNIDNLLIGKMLGDQVLGYYSRAYNLMLLPVRQISGAITRVMFPSLSIIKNDKQKVWESYSKIISITAFFTFPLMGMLYLFGDEIILLLYGEKWIGTIPILKNLCFLGAIQSIGVYCGSIFSSQGQTYLQFRVGLITKPVMILGIVIGLYYNGIMGVIFGYTLTSCLAFFIESFFLARILHQKTYQIFKGFYKEFIITSGLLFISFLVKKSLIEYNMFLVFSIVLFAGIAIYIGLALFFRLYGAIFLKEKIYGI